VKLTKLSKTSLQFGENVLAETQVLNCTRMKKNYGLPEGTIEAALWRKAKKKRIFTLDYPSYVPFVTYADNRELRKKMAIAFGARFQNNELDNQQNVFKIAKLRFDRAQLWIRYSCPLCA
jgi:peptidyl-dipeptidase Dcp